MLEGGLPASDSINAAHSKNVRFTRSHRTQLDIDRLQQGNRRLSYNVLSKEKAQPLSWIP